MTREHWVDTIARAVGHRFGGDFQGLENWSSERDALDALSDLGIAASFQALQAEDKIGTMLPCNVIIQETTDGKGGVPAVDPVASMKAIENPKLAEIAEQVRGKLKGVIEHF